MRLTLRTLLAYLDNTLEPEDAAALRAKIEESGFATQLVQRIRSSVTNTDLTAPSPDLVHPLGEANVISEYLDSTLTPEQIAEIERVCLESEPHLAEAAACHQVLTVALGKPASASDQLRRRIYLLPDSVKPEQATGQSFSSVAIPESDTAETIDGLKPDDHVALEPDGMPVEPVGLDDSGVSDAPTRLRDAEGIGQAAGDVGGSAIAGDRERGRIEVADVFAGSVRPSRIAPWLVSLALVAVLLFALTQIFSPLMTERTASNDSTEDKILLPSDADDLLPTPPEQTGESAQRPERETAVGPERTVPTERPATNDPASEDEGSSEMSETITDTAEQADPGSESSPQEPGTGDAEKTQAIGPSSGQTRDAEVADDSRQSDLNTVETVETGDMSERRADQPAAAEDETVPPGGAGPAVAASDKPAEEGADEPAKSGQDGTAEQMALEAMAADSKQTLADGDAVVAVEPPTTEEVADPNAEKKGTEDDAAGAPTGLAKATVQETLLVGLDKEQDWMRVGKETPISESLTLVNAPGFRSPMMTSGGRVELTMVGAAKGHWIESRDPNRAPGFELQFGRILVAAPQDRVSMTIVLGDLPVIVTLAELGAVAGVEVTHARQPGLAPAKPENHTRIARIFAVQGKLQFKSALGEVTLESGQQWSIRDREPASVSPMETVPGWVNPPDPDQRTIEGEARTALLELLDGEQSLEISLREAVHFRRSEVGAWAAQTLLLMDKGSVYFGSAGVLSDPQQRAYWTDHFQALRSVVDRSPEEAASLATSIFEMDAADGQTLYRLLVGYSQKQLVEGGDEELVEFLESNSMSVRILALENLREITGTTLYYRAEEENATRRSQATKKWWTRQRKGDIRWNEGEVATE